MRVKCLAQEHNTMSPGPRLEPGPLAPESSALTMRALHLPRHCVHTNLLFINLAWETQALIKNVVLLVAPFLNVCMESCACFYAFIASEHHQAFG